MVDKNPYENDDVNVPNFGEAECGLSQKIW